EDPVALVAPGGDHDDRHAGGGPQLPAHLVAVEVGQAEVEQHEVHAVGGQGVAAGGDVGDREPGPLQAPDQGYGDGLVVLDDQQVHGKSMAGGTPRCPHPCHSLTWRWPGTGRLVRSVTCMTAPVRSSPPPRLRTGVRTGGRGLPWPLWTSGWTQLPLRLFLGVTFLYAGIPKFADRSFLQASSPASFQVQLHAAVHTSPIGSLLGGVAHHAALAGVVIALAELAAGAGVLLGLWTRAAAAGGLALSIGFLLTVSWHTHPYY